MIIYDTLFDLIEQYIFGAVSVGTYQELICILVATIGSLFVVALPFAVVWRIIKIFIGR